MSKVKRYGALIGFIALFAFAGCVIADGNFKYKGTRVEVETVDLDGIEIIEFILGSEDVVIMTEEVIFVYGNLNHIFFKGHHLLPWNAWIPFHALIKRLGVRSLFFTIPYAGVSNEDRNPIVLDLISNLINCVEIHISKSGLRVCIVIKT